MPNLTPAMYRFTEKIIFYSIMKYIFHFLNIKLSFFDKHAFVATKKAFSECAHIRGTPMPEVFAHTENALKWTHLSSK